MNTMNKTTFLAGAISLCAIIAEGTTCIQPQNVTLQESACQESKKDQMKKEQAHNISNARKIHSLDVDHVLPLAANAQGTKAHYSTTLFVTNPTQRAGFLSAWAPDAQCGNSFIVQSGETVQIKNVLEQIGCTDPITALYLNNDDMDELQIVARIDANNNEKGRIGTTIPVLTPEHSVPQSHPFYFFGPMQKAQTNVSVFSPYYDATTQITPIKQGKGYVIWPHPTTSADKVLHLVDFMRDDDTGFITGTPYEQLTGAGTLGFGFTYLNEIFGLSNMVSESGDSYTDEFYSSKKQRHHAIIPGVTDKITGHGGVYTTTIELLNPGDNDDMYSTVHAIAHLPDGTAHSGEGTLRAGSSWSMTNLLEQLGVPQGSYAALELTSSRGFHVHAHTLNEKLIGETNPVWAFSETILPAQKGIIASAGQSDVERNNIGIYAPLGANVQLTAYTATGGVAGEGVVAITQGAYVQHNLRNIIPNDFSGRLEITSDKPIYAVNFRIDNKTHDYVVEKAKSIGK